MSKIAYAHKRFTPAAELVVAEAERICARWERDDRWRKW